MKALKTILIILASIIVIILAYCWSLGLFKSINVTESEAGGYHVVGLEYTGSYLKAGQTMEEVDRKLKAEGVNCSRGFGIYYDDPKWTPAEKCRSFVGSILEERDFSRIAELQSMGFRVDSVPISKAIVAEFSIKSKFSYMIGPMKVYPVISKYMNEKGYKSSLSLEIYDVPAKKIFFIMQYNQ